MTYRPFDVVTMPFPYAGRQISIVRPAVILTDFRTFGQNSGIAIVAMITSAKHSKWPFDVPISDLESAGLQLHCVVRAKLNSVAFALMERKSGSIAPADQKSIKSALSGLLAGVL